MSFLYPQFLFGLFAVLIPIAIHLFNLQRPKKVYFSNVQFLKNVEQQASSKVKLKHLLILLTRIMFILFLVLAFAQPFIPATSEVKQHRFVSLYLDNSMSMENELDKGVAITIARNLIDKTLNLYPRNTKYFFLSNDFFGKDQFPLNRGRLEERLAEVKPTILHRNAEEINKRIVSTQTRYADGAPTDVFMFSDFQKSTIGNIKSFINDTVNNYYLVPLVNNSTSNVFVDSVRLMTPYIKAGEKNTLEVKFFNSGNQKIENLNVKLIIDNDQVGTAGVDILPNASKTSTFNFIINSAGMKRCKIVFEDYPVSFDNEYYFVLEVAPQISIVHIHQNDNNYIPRLYSSESLFDLNSYDVGNIDYNKLNETDLLVLDNIQDPAEGMLEGIRAVLENGGSVAVFPSAELDIQLYNGLLNSINAPPVVKAKLDSLLLIPENKLQTPDINNPFFENVFDKMDARVDMPYALPVLNYRSVGDVLLRFKNNAPFMTAFKALEGKVYLFSTPLNNRYSTFHKHAIFVPVMYKMAFNSLNKNKRISYTFKDEFMELNVTQEGEQVYALKNGDYKLIPEQRMIGKRLLMELSSGLTEKMDVGFYDVVYGDEIIDVIALNHDKKESMMQFYTVEELKELFKKNKNVNIIEEISEDDFVRQFEEANLGTPLWRYALIVCLIFLLAEIAIIRFYKQ